MLYKDRLGEPQQAVELQRRIGRQFGRYTTCDLPVSPHLMISSAVDTSVGPYYQDGQPRPVLFYPNYEPRLRAALIASGKPTHECNQPSPSHALPEYSVLVIGFDGFNVMEEDVEAVRAFVASGGGLFLEISHQLGCRPYAHLLHTMGINTEGDTTAIDFYGSDPRLTVSNPRRRYCLLSHTICPRCQEFERAS